MPSDAEAAAAAAGETTALLTIALRSAYAGELPALNHSSPRLDAYRV